MGLTLSVVSTPNDFVDNPTFKAYKAEIIDSAIYDCGDTTYPVTTSGMTLLVTGATETDIIYIYANGELYQSLQGKTSISFKYYPAIGMNQIYAMQGEEKSNQLAFSGDLLYTLLYPNIIALRQREDEIRQAWANNYLANNIVDSTYSVDLQPTGKYLSETWASWLGVHRISGMTDSQFMTMVKAVIDIYQLGPTEKGLQLTSEAAGGTTGETYAQKLLWNPCTSITGRVRVLNGEGNTLEVFPSKVVLGSRMYNLAYSTVEITGATSGETGNTWVYVNGNESGGSLIVYQATGEPRSITTNRTEVITTGSVQSDTTGEITGYIGGKYVVLGYAPLSIVSVVSAGGLEISARIVFDDADAPTNIVDLSTMSDVADFGTLSITYSILAKEIKVLAKLSVSGETYSIFGIENSFQLGSGARYLDLKSYYTDYYMFANKEGGFSDDAVTWLLGFLRNLSHPASRGFLLTTDDHNFNTYQYHTDGYSYKGVI